jgi:hypothetical protein
LISRGTDVNAAHRAEEANAEQTEEEVDDQVPLVLRPVRGRTHVEFPSGRVGGRFQVVECGYGRGFPVLDHGYVPIEPPGGGAAAGGVIRIFIDGRRIIIVRQ